MPGAEGRIQRTYITRGANTPLLVATYGSIWGGRLHCILKGPIKTNTLECQRSFSTAGAEHPAGWARQLRKVARSRVSRAVPVQPLHPPPGGTNHRKRVCLQSRSRSSGRVRRRTHSSSTPWGKREKSVINKEEISAWRLGEDPFGAGGGEEKGGLASPGCQGGPMLHKQPLITISAGGGSVAPPPTPSSLDPLLPHNTAFCQSLSLEGTTHPLPRL